MRKGPRALVLPVVLAVLFSACDCSDSWEIWTSGGQRSAALLVGGTTDVVVAAVPGGPTTSLTPCEIASTRWESANPAVATVAAAQSVDSARVTGVASGTTTIRVEVTRPNGKSRTTDDFLVTVR